MIPLALPGSSDACAWQVVESELDALLLALEAGHMANVVAMGSASYWPDAATLENCTPRRWFW